MHKLTATIAVDDTGKASVIAGPNEDFDGQKSALRALNDAGGKAGSGKNARRYVAAYIVCTADARKRQTIKP